MPLKSGGSKGERRRTSTMGSSLGFRLLCFAALVGCAAPVAKARPSSHVSSMKANPCSSLRDRLSYYYLAASDKFQSPYIFAKPTEVLGCTQSVGFEPTRDLGTLEAIIAYFRNFYGLIHVAKDSPDPRLPSKYNIVSELRRVGRRKWSSAEDFYNAVFWAVWGLDDGHTVFVPSCPPLSFRLALPLVGVHDGDQPGVKVAPPSMMIPTFLNISKQEPFKFDALRYAGAQVVEIEGDPAWAHVALWAQAKAGNYHDLGQKVNRAFAHFTWDNGTRIVTYGGYARRMVNPGKDSVRMSLIRVGETEPELVDVPWMAYGDEKVLGGMANTESYYAAFCNNPYYQEPPSHHHSHALPQPDQADATATGLAKAGVPPPSLSPRRAKGGLGVVARMPKPRKEFTLHYKDDLALEFKHGELVSCKEDYFPVYKLSDGETTVVSLHTFYPDIPAETDAQFYKLQEFYVMQLANAFRTARKKGSRVIVDVSNNGGGYVLFVAYVQELILGTDNFPKPRYNMGLPINFLADTDVVVKMREQNLGDFNYSGYADLFERPFSKKSGKKFFFPVQQEIFGKEAQAQAKALAKAQAQALRSKVRPFARAGRRDLLVGAGRYSSFSKLSMPSLHEASGGRHFTSALGGKPFFLFSDGQCFSACSQFAIDMKVRFGVPLVSIGGFADKPMAFSAAGGGFVSENVTDSFLTVTTPEVASLHLAPKPFPMNHLLAMRFTNGFLVSKKGVVTEAPVEFTFVPADVKISYTWKNVGDPTLQYLEAVKAFTKSKQKWARVDDGWKLPVQL